MVIVINIVIGGFSGEDLKWLAYVSVKLQPTVWLQTLQIILGFQVTSEKTEIKNFKFLPLSGKSHI